jgi:hypothetical protein
MSNFRQFDRATGFLLPPSLDEWLPERHLARFVVEVIDGLDLSALGERAIEHAAVIPWCEAHGAAVTAYSPFGQDAFPKPRSAGGRMLAEVAHAHSATRRQVALAFLVRRPAVFATPKRRASPMSRRTPAPATSHFRPTTSGASGPLWVAYFPTDIVRREAARRAPG